jgi:hypothetical protein
MRTNRTEYLFSVNTHTPPTMAVDSGEEFTIEVRGAFDDVEDIRAGVGVTHGAGDGLSEFPSDLADAGTAGSAAAFSVQTSDASALVHPGFFHPGFGRSGFVHASFGGGFGHGMGGGFHGIRSPAMRTTISSRCHRLLGRGRRRRNRRAITGPNLSTQLRTVS